jgi:bifunctional UDP-N-acetylglucosamine pyrophosphorylase/glucosamine-1-phosphate N-acetyltransferase
LRVNPASPLPPLLLSGNRRVIAYAAMLTAIILAAGQGTRMKSTRPKVAHELCGRAMVQHVVQTAIDAGAEDVVVVVGYGRAEVEGGLRASFGDRVRTAVQAEQKGTGHAVACALPALRDEAELCFVLCGDTPLLEAGELDALRAAHARGEGTPMAMLTCHAADPAGYGRILRDPDGRVTGIREHRDASEAERGITEVNPGVYLVSVAFVRQAVTGLSADNAQGELYFTDVVAQAARAGGVATSTAAGLSALVGVNDRAQLAAAEAQLYERIADRLRVAGATIRSGARIDAGVEIEPDAMIEHGVVLRGKTRIGAGARVDVGSVLTDVVVEARAVIKPYTVAQSSRIGVEAQIGPFSHLRPESDIGESAHVGNFVETKKTVVRKGAKANHLAYLGDGDIGEGANVGAGTIFCNYDGFKKHRTIIGAGAFIGSDSQIVAPITIGDGAYVATGTTVTKDVPADALAISRVRQETKEGYAARLRSRLKAASGKK